MGNDEKQKAPVVQMPTPAEIKTYIMIVQTKISLFRNKKIDAIKKKKQEIAKSLRENNLDVAKAKMDSLIREEDYITAYDILGPLLEILKERVTYIITSNECPPDLRAQLDSVIYASTRLEFDELLKLRDLIMRKYGSAYIQKAENNVDKLVNINLVEKLKIKPASDAFLTIRLKQLCKEKKIPFEFPSEIISDIPGDIGNPFGPPGNNPYGGDLNPYASAQGPGDAPYNSGQGNPYGPPQGNNPYGPPQGDINPYGSIQGPPQGNNPYGPPQGPPPGGNNPYGSMQGPPPGGNNPYGSIQGPPTGVNNPYGPPQGPPPNDNNNNPFASQQGGNNNPFSSQQGGNNNPFPSQQGGNNNPFPSQQGGNNNPFPSQQGGNNNPFASQQGGNNNPFGSQQGGNNNNFGPPGNSQFSSDPNKNMNNDNANPYFSNNNNMGQNPPQDFLGGETILKTQMQNSSLNNNNEPPKSDNPYASNINNNSSNNSNPFGNDNANPFANNMSGGNPYENNNNNAGNPSDKKDDGFPKIDNEDSNPYA